MLHALAATSTRDRKVIRDQIVAILLAGRDTTAGMLTFLFYELSGHPEIVATLRSEIELTVGTERVPTYEDLKNMRYLQHCLSEALRLYPSVPFNVSCPISIPLIKCLLFLKVCVRSSSAHRSDLGIHNLHRSVRHSKTLLFPQVVVQMAISPSVSLKVQALSTRRSTCNVGETSTHLHPQTLRPQTFSVRNAGITGSHDPGRTFLSTAVRESVSDSSSH